MRHLRDNSLRVASVMAVLVLVPCWKPASIFNSTLQAQNPASFVAANGSEPASAKVDPAAAARLSRSYGKLPIGFEVNRGQTDGLVQFLARGAGYTLFLTPGEAVLSLHAPHANTDRIGSRGELSAPRASAGKLDPTPASSTVRLQLIGADTKAQAEGVDPLPGKSNYFVGNDPAKWHTDVPTYAKVRYSNVYPGIDLMYYGNQEGRLEHDFVVAPGADPNAIAIALGGGDGAVPDRDGGLTLHTKTGDLTLHSPTVYQEIKGKRRTIPASYLLADNQIKFQFGSYDRSATLVIDPVLAYSGSFGGFADQPGTGIALDSAGNAYVTGFTSATDFPLVNPFQGTISQRSVAFVSKLNAAGSALVYSTYLGCEGASNSCESITTGIGIAVDSAGRAYVVGYTYGPGFPVKNAYQPVSGGGSGADAFLTVFSPSGNSLDYSTYLGGPGDDVGNAIALDASANAYITGQSAGGFPTLHSVQAQGSVFIAKFNSAGTLQYSSVFGNNAASNAIAVDASGSAYITGETSSTSYPTVKPAYQYTCRACPNQNGFVTKLSPSGDKLAYSTFLGGPGGNVGHAIAVDTAGQAYIAGVTGTGFPVTASAFQKSFGGGHSDAFITKLNATGSSLVYSTYLGGSGDDELFALALDAYHQVYVNGQTTSPDFPQKASIQGYSGTTPKQDYVTTLSATGAAIVYYSTYFGLYSAYGVGGIAVDKALNVYMTSATLPGGIPITPGAIHISGGGYDVYVAKLLIMDDLALGLSGTPSPVVHGSNLTYTIAVTSKGPDFGYNVRVADTLPAGTTFVSYGAGGGTCTAPAVGGTGTLNCTLPQLNKGATWNVTLTVRVNAAAGTTLSNTATSVSNMQDFVPGNNTGTLTTIVK
jgi:uncharacterized repeat protein (TIGR01451 family)